MARALHETARDFHLAGVMPKRTMREFDELCLTPLKAFAPKEIERLRRREDASQAVFAHHLGVSVGLISQWERGEKKPQGASLKLLTLVEKNGLDWVA
jgi:putative transcriptional regulator